MKSSVVSIYRCSLRVAIIAAALSLLLACGQAEAPTPTVAPVATPTPTTVGPVATPTPTLVATPTSTGPATEKPRSGGTMEQFQPTLYKLRDEGRIAYRLVARGQGLYGAYMNLTKPPFNNLKLRQAVNLAMDRQAEGKVSAAKASNYRA